MGTTTPAPIPQPVKITTSYPINPTQLKATGVSSISVGTSQGTFLGTANDSLGTFTVLAIPNGATGTITPHGGAAITFTFNFSMVGANYLATGVIGGQQVSLETDSQGNVVQQSALVNIASIEKLLLAIASVREPEVPIIPVKKPPIEINPVVHEKAVAGGGAAVPVPDVSAECCFAICILVGCCATGVGAIAAGAAGVAAGYACRRTIGRG